MVILLGFCAGNLLHHSPHDYMGILTGFQQMVMRQWMDCLMDQQTNLIMYKWKGVSRYCTIINFHTGILIGIFTVNLADGRTDGTDNRHTAIQMEFKVESCFVGRQMSHATDIWTDLSG